MCAILRHRGLGAADLSPLRSASDLTADGLIVVTPQVSAQQSTVINEAAPELTATFGTGSDHVEVREVTPGGAAAYQSRLTADLASRRGAGNLILGNPSIKAAGDTWIPLASGHVDERILMALGEIAHSEPVTISSFADGDPGAAAEVPVMRTVLINVADPAAAANCLKVQDPAMQPITVRAGHANLWVEFGVPSPLGLFQAKS
jgi:hypothetical protein